MKRGKKSIMLAALLSCTLIVGIRVASIEPSYHALMLSTTDMKSEVLKQGAVLEVEVPDVLDLNKIEMLSTNPGTFECSALGVDRKLSLKGLKPGKAKLFIQDGTNVCQLEVEVQSNEEVKPSPVPSESLTPQPSENPSPQPSKNPSPQPSENPSPQPSQGPTGNPSPQPSVKPIASKIELSSTASANLTITSLTSSPTVIRYINNLSDLPASPVVNSSDSSVATVRLSGNKITVVGKKEGSAVVSVSCGNLSTVSFVVTVEKNIAYDKKINISSTSIDMYRDSTSSTKTLTIINYDKLQYSVQAYSDNSSIASVKIEDDKVIITRGYRGNTKITLYSNGATDRVIYVYVYDSKSDKSNSSGNGNNDSDDNYSTKITDIELEGGDSSITVKEDKTYTLDVELKPNKVKDTYLKFESSNTRIATVSSSGKIKGIQEGSCKVTAYYSRNDMVYDTITVRVVADDSNDKDTSNDSNKGTSKTSKNSNKTTTKSTTDVYKVKTKSGYTITNPTEIIPYVMGAGLKNISNIIDVSEDRLNNKDFNLNKDASSVAFKLDGTVYTCPVLTVTATGEEQEFVDVPKTHWAHDSIASCTSKGYLNGVGMDTYMPSTSLNYSASFTALSRALAMHDENSMNLSRSEVDLITSKFNASNWALPYYKNILSKLPMEEALRYSKLGDSVMYNTNITRINFANILYNILKDKGIGVMNQDKTYNDITKNDITSYVTERGLMCGDEKGNFNPNGYMTRAELATILLRLDYLLG